MNKLEFFIEQGEKDLPVYITHVREEFLREAGEELTLDLARFDGGTSRVCLKLPIGEARTAAERVFLKEYVFAEVYNMLSALGGKGLRVYHSGGEELEALLSELPGAFGIGQSRKERRGYGRCVNVTERMLDSQGIKEPFFIDIVKGGAPELSEESEPSVDFVARFKKAFEGVERQILCGVDIGGTDIKLAVSVRGKLCYLKEYDWFPALFTRSRQLIEPVRLLVRLLRARISCDEANITDVAVIKQLDRAIDEHVSDSEIEAAVAAAESALGGEIRGFDGIGLCFPDVVIRNKIVGGEVFKTRGIRDNPEIEYEAEFRKLMNLDAILAEYCEPGSTVRMTNDGPMAAYTAALELIAQGRGEELADGRFAHTLGTELGTGWVDERGEIPEIPLEIYNFIIDLGSFAARKYHPDDLRSINNFNTGLPGTLQKFMAQNGVFRLAIKASLESGGELYDDLLEKGYVYEKDGGVFVTLEPKDMRKPLLERLMQLCEEGDPLMREVFLELGRSTGITFRETEHVLHPRTKERVMYGRLVKTPVCFGLIKQGAAQIDETLRMSVADSSSAFTELMRQLNGHAVYSVAQFAQAVGAVYYGNYDGNYN